MFAQGTRGRRIALAAPMVILIVIVAFASIGLHRTGISWGDDYALYLRQAESLYEGNIGEVIADNHFNVDNAARPGFSPYVYPWGFPILLAPVARLFGQDWAMLKLVGVAAFCVFLWAFHAVLRVRMERWLAFSVVAVVGTSLVYLQHTGLVLSEFPYMASFALAFWYLDRIRRDGPLQHVSTSRLVALGLWATWVFNVRREGLAFVAAIAVAMAVDLWPDRRRLRAVAWRRVATPFATFVAAVIGFQLLLPSTLVPQYVDSGLHQTWKKLQGPFHADFADQLGFPAMARHADLRGALLWIVFLLALIGVVVRCWRAPRQDLPLAVFAVGSMTIVGMIPAVSNRYLMPVTPFAIYFAAQAIASLPLPRRAGSWIAVGALALLTMNHLTRLPSAIDEVQQLNDRGAVQDGPAAPDVTPAFEAVRTYTHEDDVVAFFKVRLLTYMTGRRGVQASDTPQVLYERSDFYLMRRGGTGSQPLVSDSEGVVMGWEIVWEDPEWVLWRLPRPAKMAPT